MSSSYFCDVTRLDPGQEVTAVVAAGHPLEGARGVTGTVTVPARTAGDGGVETRPLLVTTNTATKTDLSVPMNTTALTGHVNSEVKGHQGSDEMTKGQIIHLKVLLVNVSIIRVMNL